MNYLKTAPSLFSFFGRRYSTKRSFNRSISLGTFQFHKNSTNLHNPFFLLLPPIVFLTHVYQKRQKALCESIVDGKLFTKADVQKHNCKETGIWVTYKDGVYDVTDFVDNHPGGEKILLAAGKSVDPFWALYAVHKKDEVLEILEEMRIGTLQPGEATPADKIQDPFSNDPLRHPALIACSEKPYNAETPPELLNDEFLTPNEIFFVRNHLPVPHVDMKNYKMTVAGPGVKTTSFTLDELKRKFKPVTITATLQCAGNRRNEMNQVKMVKGLTWGSTAISNAQWTGFRLSEVLRHVGLDEKTIIRENLLYCQFEGLDNDPTSTNTFYGASIDLDRAIDPKKDVILAYEMNGQPLPQDHGFPLRVIVPGVVGARNVKWLSKIIVSNEESHSHWQRRDYKSFCPSTDWDTVDFDSAPSIQEYPVQSAICMPKPNQKIKRDQAEIEVKGYAWSGGGRKVIRVDISSDNGKTWQTAKLDQNQADFPPYQSWAWTLWSCNVAILDANKELEIICKATDVVYNSQPDNAAGIWNLRGVLNNAWHRVKVQIID